MLQNIPFQINAVIFDFLIIKESRKKYNGFRKNIKLFSALKRSCDPEHWSKGFWKFSFDITGINHILKLYENTNQFLNCINIFHLIHHILSLRNFLYSKGKQVT